MKLIEDDLKEINGGGGEIYYTFFVDYIDASGRTINFESSAYGDKSYCTDKLSETVKRLMKEGCTILNQGIRVALRSLR